MSCSGCMLCYSGRDESCMYWFEQLMPKLMELDLQSVEKVILIRSHELSPRKCWKLVSVASE